MIDPAVRKYMSKLGKRARALNPKPKAYYQAIQKKSVASRLAKKKLSTSQSDSK